jgi:hypothetical protein
MSESDLPAAEQLLTADDVCALLKVKKSCRTASSA